MAMLCKHFARMWLSFSVMLSLQVVSRIRLRRDAVSLIEVPQTVVWLLAFALVAVDGYLMWTFWKEDREFRTASPALLFTILATVQPNAASTWFCPPVWFLFGVQAAEVLFFAAAYHIRNKDEAIKNQMQVCLSAWLVCILACLNYPYTYTAKWHL